MPGRDALKKYSRLRAERWEVFTSLLVLRRLAGLLMVERDTACLGKLLVRRKSSLFV